MTTRSPSDPSAVTLHSLSSELHVPQVLLRVRLRERGADVADGARRPLPTDATDAIAAVRALPREELLAPPGSSDDLYGEWSDHLEAERTRERVVTPQQARAELRIEPGTVRQWAARGLLESVGTIGRAKLYRFRDLERLKDRQHDGGRTFQILDVPAKRRENLVTGPEAARLISVSPATIRSWAHRGKLTSVAPQGKRPLYVIREVLELGHSTQLPPHGSPYWLSSMAARSDR